MIELTRRGSSTLVAGYQPVMGTNLELHITTATESASQAAESAAVAEAVRLEKVFTVFDPMSDLCLWRSGASTDPGPELASLLAIAAWWQERSGGAFNPATSAVTARWSKAAETGAVPRPSELDRLAAAIAVPRFVVGDHGIVRAGDCSDVDLNAIAKGQVVDLVAQHLVLRHGVGRLVVNAGGDLVHVGAGAVRVAVEDPLRPFANAAPLDVIEISNAAVATSGRSHRWFDVAGTRHSRVLDPRNARPVGHTSAATVVAGDAATADVLATVASVLAPDEALRFVDDLSSTGRDIACLIVDEHGRRYRNDRWSALARPSIDASPPRPAREDGATAK